MSIAVAFEPIRERAASTFDGTFQTFGTPITHPARLLKVINNSNQDVDISFNGTDQHDFVPTGGFTLYDFTSNKVDLKFEMAEATQVYVRSAGGVGTGDVYLVVIGERV